MVSASRSEQSVLKCNTPGGVVTVVCYTGHPGGAEESEAVEKWAAGLDRKHFDVVRHDAVHRHQQAPFLIAVERGDS